MTLNEIHNIDCVQGMRDRLIELIESGERFFTEDDDYDEMSEFLADRILDDGYIRPPCKVGNKVWWLQSEDCEFLPNVLIGKVVSFSVQEEGLWAYCRYECGLTYWHKVADYFGKTVFLTREAAERALKGLTMREILFRGKRKDNGEWVEGLPFYGINNEIDGIEATPKCDDLHTIISSTVGQYTGLTDKNGKKIFEGDIVQYYGTYPLEVYIENGHTKVRWFDTVTNSECTELFFGYDEEAYGECEVIGNIHDNPELLKVGAE